MALLAGAFHLVAKADSDKPTDTNQSDALTIKPDKCISLRQGLVCYQRVKFTWRLDDAGEYCLVEDSDADPIKCWSQQRAGSLITEFAARESTHYYLIDRVDNRRIGKATMQVAWVYRNKKRNRKRWRLF
jgi:hypothetical protein